MISKTNEYALRVVTFLGEDLQRSATNAAIAKITGVPAGYLYKIMTTLEKAGVVRSQRGKHGGYSLNRLPSEISVLDVVSVIDPLPRIRRCPLGLKAHCKQLCPLHECLDSTYALIEKTMSKSMISDFLINRGPLSKRG
jgi:Rrf2 family nitric oxide-sensitive transcriptional repressor